MGQSMFHPKRTGRILGLAVSLTLLIPRFAAAQSEWLTWGHDPERTGSNPEEKVLNKDNVSQLEVKWTAQISTAPKEYILSTMTAPLVATIEACACTLSPHFFGLRYSHHQNRQHLRRQNRLAPGSAGHLPAQHQRQPESTDRP